MRSRASTIDLIAREYADALAAGNFDQAAGWFATAKLVHAREAERRPVPERRTARVHLRSSRPLLRA